MAIKRPLLARLTSLVRLLLRSLPDDTQISDLLRAAYLSNTDTDRDPVNGGNQENKSIKPLLPYYSFVTNVTFEHCSRPNQGIFLNAILSSCHDFLELVRSRPVNPSARDWSLGDEIPVEDASLELYRDLVWTLCVNAEHIRTLVLPLLSISRYLPLIHRFRVLSNVGFLMDDRAEPDDQLSNDEEDALELQQDKQIQRFDDMILFVQEHQRQQSTSTLRMAQFTHIYSYDNVYPKKYKNRLFQLLSPLTDPRYIDNSNWDHFLAKFQETNLSFVRRLYPSFGERDTEVLDRLIEQGPFLHRFRSLETFNTESTGDDMFQWAVDERRIYDTEIGAGRTPQIQLVPLRMVSICYGHDTYGRQLNDIAFAFNKTLETMSATLSWYPEGYDNQLEFTRGGDFALWNMSRLTHLILDTNNTGMMLRLHPDLLLGCPRLTHLTLDDKRRRLFYRQEEIVYWSPAALPDLIDLRLEGTLATCFHPETLMSTRNLVRLNLRTTNSIDDPFIPPAEELNMEYTDTHSDDITTSTPFLKRPVWTWDWELPKLTSLTLTSEIAYWFQFRMLDGTPNLEHFSVDTKSLPDQYERTIGLSDLLKPGSACRQSFSSDMEYIHLPKLYTFYLLGSWTLDGPQVLTALFSRVAPRIECLGMNGCDGFSLEGWVGLTSRHLHELRDAAISIATDSEMLSEVGLVMWGSQEDYDEDEAREYLLVDRPEGRIVEKDSAVYTFE
ncbi:hypothetical protein BGX33_007746 [Mortierella sp. NVP41]|nr:hypothetical protein BGX33_007746 [Mortierella sp. NVP41]